MYIISSKKEDIINHTIEDDIKIRDDIKTDNGTGMSDKPEDAEKSACYKDRYTVSGGELGGARQRSVRCSRGSRDNTDPADTERRSIVGSIGETIDLKAPRAAIIPDVSAETKKRFRRHARSSFRETASAGKYSPRRGGNVSFGGKRLAGRQDGRYNTAADTAALIIIAFFVIGFVTGCVVWNTDGAGQQCSVFVERYMNFTRGSGFYDCFGAGVVQQLPALAAIAVSAFFVAGFVACPVIVFVRGMGTAMVICSLFSGLSLGQAPELSGGVGSSSDIMLSGGAALQGDGTVSGSALTGHMFTEHMINMNFPSERGGMIGSAAAALYIALTTAVLIKAASDAAGISSEITARGTVRRYGGFLLRAALYALALAAVSALHAGAVYLLR